MQSASIPQKADLTLVIHDEGSSFVLCKSNRRRQRDCEAQECLLFISLFFLLRSVEMMDKRGERRRTRIVNVSYFQTVDVTVPWRIEFLYFLHPRPVHSNHNMVTYIVTLTSQASC